MIGSRLPTDVLTRTSSLTMNPADSKAKSIGYSTRIAGYLHLSRKHSELWKILTDNRCVNALTYCNELTKQPTAVRVSLVNQKATSIGPLFENALLLIVPCCARVEGSARFGGIANAVEYVLRRVMSRARLVQCLGEQVRNVVG